MTTQSNAFGLANLEDSSVSPFGLVEDKDCNSQQTDYQTYVLPSHDGLLCIVSSVNL